MIKGLQKSSHDFYLRQDVLLLMDMLLEFKNMCVQTYNLNALQYYAAPGLTFDAGLKFTNEKLQLLTDDRMSLFVESGMRGGISVISQI